MQVARSQLAQRADKFSYDARLILAKVWAACGGQCGKYLAASMLAQLDALERHGELCLDGGGRLDPQGRYGPGVRAELLAMSVPCETARDRACVAVVAALGDLGASGDWIPCRFSPCNGGAVLPM